MTNQKAFLTGNKKRLKGLELISIENVIQMHSTDFLTFGQKGSPFIFLEATTAVENRLILTTPFPKSTLTLEHQRTLIR